MMISTGPYAYIAVETEMLEMALRKHCTADEYTARIARAARTSARSGMSHQDALRSEIELAMRGVSVWQAMNVKMNVKGIVTEWLKANGYDGLSRSDCGCGIDELMPCDWSCDECQPAYVHTARESNEYFDKGVYYSTEKEAQA